MIFCGSDVVEFGSECDQLIKSACSRNDERCRIDNDAVRYVDLHCLLDEAAIRTIRLQRRSEVKPDKPEVVPRFAYRVLNNDEGAA